MSLFDDDFYSSKISRRARRAHLDVRRPSRSKRFSFRGWRKSKLSTLQIAFISSFTGAIVACIIFGLTIGFGSKVETDPSERAITATNMVRPSVVSVINEQKFSLELGGGALDPDSADSGVYRAAGAGSGLIFQKHDDAAYIVTNYHVIATAHRVKAVLTNGEEREAEVVGMDQLTDLAVLKIDSKGIDEVAALGDSSKVRAAEFVVAIGNPLGMGESITLGVVSVTNETVAVSLNQNGVMDWEQEVIRVDAAINQGNSGGPLIDLNGQVIGINSMKISNFGVESIGYAIPINNVVPIIDELIETGYVARPYLGVYMMDLQQYWSQQELDKQAEATENGTEGESQLKLPRGVYEGIIVQEAVGPALEAGLQPNDVIVQLDETKVNSTRLLRKYLYNYKDIGDKIDVKFYRDSELKEVTLVLGENKPE